MTIPEPTPIPKLTTPEERTLSPGPIRPTSRCYRPGSRDTIRRDPDPARNAVQPIARDSVRKPRPDEGLSRFCRACRVLLTWLP
jgi:hypothetical protein